MKAIKRIRLSTMPFDRWDSELHEFVHATGYWCQLETGEFVLEWEDDLIEDAPNCVYEDEDDDEGEDWMPEISAEDYAEWTGKGWLYE